MGSGTPGLTKKRTTREVAHSTSTVMKVPGLEEGLVVS